jgi:WD40 repeat protein
MNGKHALIIGNTEYSDPGLSKLSAPGKDAEAFAHVLRAKELCAFDDVQVLLNKPEPAVREAIDGFFDEKRPDDLLVLYFSGHGVRDEYGSLYLAVRNTNRLRLRSTAIESDFIRKSMDQSRSRRQVLILDCCNSGAFAQGAKAATGVSIGTASAFEGTGYGRVVLTASDSTQFAWEGDKIIGDTQNSLFTHFLVKGLEGEADNDGDGRITIDELYDYAYGEIVNITPKQTPGKWTYKQQGEILLRQSTRMEDVRPMKLPEDLVEEAQDTRPYVREAAVQKLAKILQGRNIGLARSAREALEKIAADEDTTRRVALAATQALEAYRRSQETLPGETSSPQRASDAAVPVSADQQPSTAQVEVEKSPKDVRQIAVEAAAAKLRAREVTEQLAEVKAQHDRAAKSEEEAKQHAVDAGRLQRLTRNPMRLGMASVALIALLVLGYVGKTLLWPGQTPSTAAPTDVPAETSTAEATAASTEASTTAAPAAPVVLSADGDVFSVAFSPDGNILASGSISGEIILWDEATHERLGDPLKGHSGANVNSVAFSPDGNTLASGGDDGTVVLWDVQNRNLIGVPLRGHTDHVTSVAFSPDGKTLASASWDSTIILWDVETRHAIGQPLTGNSGSLLILAFSPDGKILASGGDDRTIQLWDVENHQPMGKPLKGHNDSVRSLAFSPDGRALVSGSDDNTIIAWDPATGQPIGQPVTGHSSAVTSLAFSPDGKLLASGSWDNTVILWNTDTGQQIGSPLAKHSNSVFSVAFSPDGKILASGSQDGTIVLWDVAAILSGTTQ